MLVFHPAHFIRALDMSFLGLYGKTSLFFWAHSLSAVGLSYLPLKSQHSVETSLLGFH